LARKPNYGFDKRKKEQDRKAKKDAKREERRQRREEEPAADPNAVALQTDLPERDELARS
jgi:hypothetical protein